MPTVISKLAIQLSSTGGAQLKKGFDQGRGATDQLKRTVDKLRGAFRLLSGVIGGISVAGFGLLVKRKFQTIDATAKLADRIGETTENISRLGFAAQITGGSQDQLNQAIDVFNKRLGEAAQGSGEAKAALELLGLDPQRLAAMRTAEAFKTVADRIAALPTQADKAAATADLFSRANLNLVNTLELGRDGLDKLGREADALGKTFTRLEAQRVEKANDAVTRFKEAIGGLATQMSILLAPAVEVATDVLTEFLKAVRGQSSMVNNAAVKIGIWVASFVAALTIIPKVVAAIRSIVVALRALAAGQAIATAFAPGGLVKLAVSGAAATAAVVGITAAFKETNSELDDAVKNTQQLADGLSEAQANSAGIGVGSDAVAQTQSQLDQAEARLQTLREDAAELQSLLDDPAAQMLSNSMITGLTEDLIAAQRAVASAENDVGDLVAKLERINPPSVEAMADALRDGADAAKEWQRTAERIADSVQTPFEEFESKIDEINGAFSRGGLSVENYRRAIVKAKKDLDDATGSAEALRAASDIRNVQVSAASRGSNEALSAIADARAAQHRQLAATRAHLAESREHTRLLGLIHDRLEEGELLRAADLPI